MCVCVCVCVCVCERERERERENTEILNSQSEKAIKQKVEKSRSSRISIVLEI